MAGDATRILDSIDRAEADGDVERAAQIAADELLPAVYDDLRAVAAARLANDRGRYSLDATGLVHEAWMRLVGTPPPEAEDGDGSGGASLWNGRRHFMGAAAIAMGRILVDRARARGAAKRGGGRARLDLDSGLPMTETDASDLTDLDGALTALAAERPEHAEIVRLRVFLGMTIPDAAAVLGVSTNTADRRWAFARAWLATRMES